MAKDSYNSHVLHEVQVVARAVDGVCCESSQVALVEQHGGTFRRADEALPTS
ncbi:hypothetical protein JYU34_005589 [Plutella xylostella]|uniref:Uncharacterized protein n=1 Tax=Plutella xylostella TaxID=51655 RepID=A0ABQ7QTM2_PLUXY|nr:hypothetical protein JYU34_005589 [Plutella xylostella]